MTHTCNDEDTETLLAECPLELLIGSFRHGFAIDFQALNQELAVSNLANSPRILLGSDQDPQLYRPSSVLPRPLQARDPERRTGRKRGYSCSPSRSDPPDDSCSTAAASYRGSLSLNVHPSRRFGKYRKTGPAGWGSPPWNGPPPHSYNI